MKVLFITSHYLDDNNGGANAAKGHIYSIAAVFNNTSLIYPERKNCNTGDLAPKSMTLYPCFDNRSPLKKFVDVYLGRIHRFTNFVKQHLEKNKYDLIVFDHSRTSSGIITYAQKNGAKIVTIHQNVERDYLRDNKPNFLIRIPYLYHALKAEKMALCQSDVNLVLTHKDNNSFNQMYPGKDLHMHRIGICEFQNIEENVIVTVQEPVFIITGSLCFKQSLLPIIEFLSNYYPSLCDGFPHNKLIIAGRNPTRKLLKICETLDNVKIIPSPSDMTSVMKMGKYYICPINKGSGIKLRVLDGLKQGLPVLCHEKSAVGYEFFVEKGIIFTYHDLNSFKISLNRMICNPISSEQVFTILNQEFSLDSGVRRMRDILTKEGIIE